MSRPGLLSTTPPFFADEAILTQARDARIFLIGGAKLVREEDKPVIASVSIDTPAFTVKNEAFTFVIDAFNSVDPAIFVMIDAIYTVNGAFSSANEAIGSANDAFYSTTAVIIVVIEVICSAFEANSFALHVICFNQGADNLTDIL